MDETLLHKVWTSDKNQLADIYVQVPTEDGLNTVKVCWHSFPIVFGDSYTFIIAGL